MTLTLTAVRALKGFDGTLAECAEKMAPMVLRAARGNSGAILSLFFRGMSKALAGVDEADSPDIAKAMKKGTEEEYKAVITVPYIPGTLRAEAVDEQGNPIAAMNIGHNTLRTAGEPYALRLTADRTIITADGQDLSFITIEVVDKQGTLCPNAVNELTLSLRGRATLAAFGNADIKDLGCTVDAIHNVWKGRALAVVRASDRSSNAILTLSGKGLKSAQVTVKIK